MRTYRKNRMHRRTQRAGVGKCTGTKSDGANCGKKCVGERCATHQKMYERDNPKEKLVATDTQNAKDAITILDKMREPEGMKLLEQGFVEMLVSREVFPPAENVNKFVTGGVAEDVIAEIIPKLGFPTENVAATKTVIDIEVKIGDRVLGISLKNSGSIDQQPILENYRGESRSEVRKLPPSFIIYTETKNKRARIVYIDDDIIRQTFPPDISEEEFNAKVYNVAKDNKQSSLTFKSGFLRSFIPKLPESYIVDVKFPETIPKVEKKSITLLALEFVRKAIASSKEREKPRESCYDCGENPGTIEGDAGTHYCEKCWVGSGRTKNEF